MFLHRKLIAAAGVATMVAAFAVAPAAYAAEGDAGVAYTHIDPSTGQAVGAEPDLTVTAGDLTFDEVDADVVDTLHFHDIRLTGSPQLTGLRIPPFSVIDATGSEAGWHVTLTMGDLVNAGGTNGYTIPATAMSMTRPTVTDLNIAAAPGAATRSNSPDVLGQDVASFAGAEDIVVATDNAVTDGSETGGTFFISPSPLRVIVPSDAIAGTYNGTIDLDLVSGP
jgi:hypothetical protein